MISNTAQAAAAELAAGFKLEGQRVEALPGSVLHELSQANISLRTQMSLESLRDEGFSSEMIITDSRPDHGGRHNEIMDHAVEVVGDLMRGNLTLVRQQVIPLATQVLGEYLNQLEAIDEGTHAPVEIYPNIWDRVWSNGHLKTLLKDFERVQQPTYVNTRHFPSASFQTLNEMLVTGVPAIDELLVDWRSNFDEERLLDAYNKVFRPVGEPAVLGQSTGIKHVTSLGLRRDDMLACWMIARNLPEMIEGETQMTLDEMRRHSMLIRHAIGHGLYKELEKRNLAKRSNNLVFDEKKRHVKTVRRGNEVTHQIYVNNDVYVKWLDEGGSPEALFGAVVSSQPLRYEYMLENKIALEGKWKKYQMQWNQIADSNEISTKRLAFKRAFSDVLASINLEDHYIYMELSELRERIDQVSGSLHRMIYSNDRRLIRRGVCDICYPGTNARYILDTMAEIGQENEIDDPREAATLTAFDLYARWAASQMKRMPM